MSEHTLFSCALTHLVNVFFCTSSRSSVTKRGTCEIRRLAAVFPRDSSTTICSIQHKTVQSRENSVKICIIKHKNEKIQRKFSPQTIRPQGNNMPFLSEFHGIMTTVDGYKYNSLFFNRYNRWQGNAQKYTVQSSLPICQVVGFQFLFLTSKMKKHKPH